MGKLSSQKLALGVFDHFDDAGVDISRQNEARLSLVEAYDQLGFHAYHVAEHHCTPPPPFFLPVTFDAAIQSELCVAGTEASVRNALLS
jgi:alkanesulfonate monooxygenase SsuD/methylene tetrahydromethanopterin reductase-like flavin-dependent oxidoreductase (luciferase family)